MKSAIRWMQRFIFSFVLLARKPLACEYLESNAPDTKTQVRFMAVDENARGRGYGRRILAGLEAEATRRGSSY